MMKEIMRMTEEVIEKELELACEEHGNEFASSHEAYAVIKEEYEEAREEIERVGTNLNRFWNSIKWNLPENYDEFLKWVYKNALRGACELIQTAAMAKKACGEKGDLLTEHRKSKDLLGAIAEDEDAPEDFEFYDVLFDDEDI